MRQIVSAPALQSKKTLLAAVFICLAAYLLTLYVPLITQAGISVDDWGDIAHNLECSSFWHCYGTWFPLFANRPLAPLPITTLTFLLGTWYSGYLIVNSLIYLAAIGVCTKVIIKITPCASLNNSIIFVLFAVIPMIAMPVITSPINQSTATISFLLWAISLWCLFRYLQFSGSQYFFLSYSLLLAAFLTYEVILPLLVLTAALPWIFDSKKFSLLSVHYWVKFIAPILVVLAIITLWQKGIAPQFMTVDSRLKFIPAHALAKLHTFFQVFYTQIPTLFFKMSPYLKLGGAISAALALLTLFLGNKYYPFKIPEIRSESSRRWRFFSIALLCFLSSSLIFILSDESAISGGYQARGLSSTWFAFAILLCAIQPYNRLIRILWTSFLAIFLTMSVLSFSVQRDQTIRAWKMQLNILRDATQLIKLKKVPENATILGDVPHYLPKNYNNEIVFSQPWDFGAALSITLPVRINPGPVIDSSRQELRQLNFHKGTVVAENFAGSTLDNFWVYQFNVASKQGTLVRIEDPIQFESLLIQLHKRAELLQ